MQPKARMTFRFDGTVPAKPEPQQPNRTEKFRTEAHRTETHRVEAHRAKEHSVSRETAPHTEGMPETANPVSPASPAASRTNDFQAWNGPYQDDIHALEEMIRNTDPMPVAGFSKTAKSGGSRPQTKTQPKALQAEPAIVSPIEPILQPPIGARIEPMPELPEKPAHNRQQSGQTGRTIPFPGSYRGNRPEAEEEEETFEEQAEFDHGWIAAERYSRGEGPSWWRVFVTVVGAIATGGLFGYLLLTLFTGEPLFPKNGEASPDALPAAAAPYALSSGEPAASQGGQASSGTAAGQAEQGGTKQSASMQTFTAPAVSLYLLQYGVFQTEERMKEAAKELRAKGIAAATDQTDGYRVYAGVSPTKAEAEALVEHLAGTQVYLKTWEAEKLQIAGSEHAREYADFLSASASLNSKIAGYASSVLAGSDPASGDDIQSVRTAHQVWLEKAKAAESWQGAAKESAQAEIVQLNAAIAALNTYADKASESLLWDAQSAAMEAAFADRSLRTAIAQESGS